MRRYLRCRFLDRLVDDILQDQEALLRCVSGRKLHVTTTNLSAHHLFKVDGGLNHTYNSSHCTSTKILERIGLNLPERVLPLLRRHFV